MINHISTHLKLKVDCDVDEKSNNCVAIIKSHAIYHKNPGPEVELGFLVDIRAIF